jgi:hypothetical protein
MNTETMTKPTCPDCGSHEVAEMASTRVEYPIAGIAGGEPRTMPGQTSGDGEFDGFECRSCFYESNEIADFVVPDPEFAPGYDRWRHGGWYVLGVRHKNGGIGCVSRNPTGNGGSSATRAAAITPTRAAMKLPARSSRSRSRG